jgi:hypothetical protein
MAPIFGPFEQSFSRSHLRARTAPLWRTPSALADATG